MPSGLDYLTVPRLTGVMKGLQDQRELPGDLLFVSKLPMTPAMEGELMALEVSRTLIADVIADNAGANIVRHGKLGLVTNTMAAIKLGSGITPDEMIQLASIASQNIPTYGDAAGDGGGNEFLGNYIARRVKNLRDSLYNRLEIVSIAMHLGTYNYNRFGFMIKNETWGMPSDLQLVATNAWSDTTNGDAANDIINANLYAQTRYGKTYNRLTMSLPAFRAMIAQTKFQNLARMYLAPNVSYVNLPTGDIGYQKNLAMSVLGISEIRIQNKRAWNQDPDTGRLTSQPYLPLRTVILDSTENDNNAACQDIANGATVEGMVSSFLGSTPTTGVIGQFNPNARGPISYATVRPDLNPAELTIWASMRGWPRRREQVANMVLDVGSLSDSIPVGEPALV